VKSPNEIEPPTLDIPGMKDPFIQEVFGDPKSKKKKPTADHRKDEDSDESGDESEEEEEGSDDEDESHFSQSSSTLPTLSLAPTKSDDGSHSPRGLGVPSLAVTAPSLTSSGVSAIFGSEVRLVVDEFVSFDLQSLSALLFADPNFTIEIHTLENDTDIFVEPWQKDETKERYRREVRLRKKKDCRM